MNLRRSILVAAAVPGTSATRQRHAICAENFPGDLQRVKTATAFARGLFR